MRERRDRKQALEKLRDLWVTRLEEAEGKREKLIASKQLYAVEERLQAQYDSPGKEKGESA